MLKLITKSSLKSTFRSFSTSSISKSHEVFREGVYSNLPFKVHNRKIPFAIPYFTFMGKILILIIDLTIRMKYTNFIV